MPGQLALFKPMRRTLTLEHAGRLRGRDFTELRALRAAIDATARERGLSEGWRLLAVRMTRLALACREPGEDLVREEDLAQLPELRGTTAELLRATGLLHSRKTSWAPALHTRPEPKNCEFCFAWSGTAQRLCSACKNWRRLHRVMVCRRCRRTLPTAFGHCRLCRVVLLEARLEGRAPVDQLWFGGDVDLYVNKTYHRIGGERSREARRIKARRRPRPVLVLSPHLVDPAQLELFPPRGRRWEAVENPGLVELTPQAAGLVQELRQLTREQSWADRPRKTSLRTLRLLVGWLGADAAIHESDVRAAGSLSQHHSACHVVGFLKSKGLLIEEDPDRPSMPETAAYRYVREAPARFQSDLHTWIAVLRGRGRRPSRMMPWPTIRTYVFHVASVLATWQHLQTLREADEGDIAKAAVNSSILNALRSFFRALKRERVIFRDPARNVHHAPSVRVPKPIPSDRLRGLLDQVPGSKDKLALLLIAVYAIRPTRVGELLLTDLDRGTGRLRVRDGHDVYLDQYALDLVTGHLRERHRRWPASTNPHLLVSAKTAMHLDQPPIAHTGFWPIYERIGLNSIQLRQDRYLDEARETADPVHLMRVFGISSTTAIRYVHAAYPDRFATDPTQA